MLNAQKLNARLPRPQGGGRGHGYTSLVHYLIILTSLHIFFPLQVNMPTNRCICENKDAFVFATGMIQFLFLLITKTCPCNIHLKIENFQLKIFDIFLILLKT